MSGDGPVWNDEAAAMLAKVPGFVRPMAKKIIEQFAAERQAAEITAELVREARARFGM